MKKQTIHIQTLLDSLKSIIVVQYILSLYI